MNDDNKKLMLEVRYAVLKLIKSFFDDIDKELRKHTYKDIHGQTVIKSARARLGIKGIRNDKLRQVATLGEDKEMK